MAMHESLTAILPFVLPGHVIEAISGLIFLVVVLGLALFAASLVTLKPSRPGRHEALEQPRERRQEDAEDSQPGQIRTRESSTC